MKNKLSEQNKFEKDMFLTDSVASATECTGRNAIQPVNADMAQSYEEICKSPIKPAFDRKNGGKKP